MLDIFEFINALKEKTQHNVCLSNRKLPGDLLYCDIILFIEK